MQSRVWSELNVSRKNAKRFIRLLQTFSRNRMKRKNLKRWEILRILFFVKTISVSASTIKCTKKLFLWNSRFFLEIFRIIFFAKFLHLLFLENFAFFYRNRSKLNFARKKNVSKNATIFLSAANPTMTLLRGSGQLGDRSGIN